MDAIEQLQQRVDNAVRGLFHEMTAAGDASGVLPLERITVERTATGVVVEFIESAPIKKSAKAEKAGDES